MYFDIMGASDDRLCVITWCIVTSIPPPGADALQVRHQWPNSSCFCLLDFHLNCLVTIARTSKSDVKKPVWRVDQTFRLFNRRQTLLALLTCPLIITRFYYIGGTLGSQNQQFCCFMLTRRGLCFVFVEARAILTKLLCAESLNLKTAFESKRDSRR